MKITIEFDPLELARGALQTTTERQVGPSTPTTLPDMASPDMALARTSGGAIDAGPGLSPPAPEIPSRTCHPGCCNRRDLRWLGAKSRLKGSAQWTS